MKLHSRTYRAAKNLMSDLRFCMELEFLRALPLRWSVRYLQWRAFSTYHYKTRAIQWKLRRRPNEMPALASRQQELDLHLKFTLARLLGMTLLSRDAARHETLFATEGLEHIQDARRRGNGAVLLTTHLGIPALLRWFLRTVDYPVIHLYKMSLPKSPKDYHERKLLWLRRRHRIDEATLIGDEDCSVQYMKKALTCLKDNGIVNISGDGRIGDRRIPVNVFGRQYSFPVGGLTLGIMNGAPILPCFCDADPGPRFCIRVQEPLDVPADAPRAEQLQLLVESYAARIEEYLTRYPTFSCEYFPAMFPRG